MTSKFFLMSSLWLLALMVSFAFRFWGQHHPSEFEINPFVVWVLVFGPSFALGSWLVWNKSNSSISSS